MVYVRKIGNQLYKYKSVRVDGKVKAVYLGKCSVRNEDKKDTQPEIYIKQARIIFNKIPKRYTKYLSGEIVYTDKNVAAMVDTDEGTLFVGHKWKNAKTQQDRFDLVYHELSHVILKKNVKCFDKKVSAVFEKGYATEPKFDKDPFEDFVDSIAAYIQPHYRKSMKKKLPLKYKAVDMFMSCASK